MVEEDDAKDMRKDVKVRAAAEKQAVMDAATKKKVRKPRLKSLSAKHDFTVIEARKLLPQNVKGCTLVRDDGRPSTRAATKRLAAVCRESLNTLYQTFCIWHDLDGAACDQRFGRGREILHVRSDDDRLTQGGDLHRV